MLRPFELKKLQTSLFVSDHYALMVSESQNDYTFVFTFSILRNDVSKHKIRFLKVKAQRKDFQSIIPFQQKTQTVQSLLKKNIEQVKLAQKKREATLAETKVDLNIYKSDDAYISKLVLEKVTPITRNYVYEGGVTAQGSITEKYKNLKIINKHKIDPSEVFFDKNYSNITEVQQLKNYYTIDALEAIKKDNSYYKSFRKIVENNKIVGYATLSIPKISGADDLEIVFELYKDGNDTLLFEPKSKNLSISKFLDIKNQIKVAPSIHVAYNSSGKFNSLQLTQNDETAKVVELKKKTVNNSGFASPYTTTGIYALEKDKRQLVGQANSISEIQIYRCAAYENNALSKKNYKQKTIIAGTTFGYIDGTVLMITDDKPNNCVVIKLMYMPEDSTEFLIYRRKLLPGTTAFDDYEMIGVGPTKPTTPVILDKQVRSGHIYEYFVKYKMRGVVIDSVKRLHKYLNPKNFDNVVTLINSTAIGSTDDKVTVSFTVTTTLVNKETNIIKTALEKNNIYNEFADEFDKIKDKLQDLVFYKVSRTNLSISPGLKEEFKDILSVGSGDGTSISFSDSPATRQASGISEIDPSATYFYEFKAYFKNPLALLRDYVKEVPTQTKQGDSKTVLMKKHMYRPYKWIQEKVKNTGTMLAEDDDGNFTEINLIEDGEAGVVASTTISNMQLMLGIEACNAERFDLNTVIVSWSLQLSNDMYDHFVIVKEVDQKRQLIATVTQDRYIDTVKQSEAGSVIYYVIPVFKDYSVGAASRSNTIVIEPEEFLG